MHKPQKIIKNCLQIIVVLGMVLSSLSLPYAPITHVRADTVDIFGDWTYHLGLTVHNNAAIPLPVGYSARYVLDTAALIGQNRLQSDCDDLRLSYGDGEAESELDRTVEGCNTAATTIWFRTQAEIAPSEDGLSYHLHYGNELAGSAPSSPENVFAFYDDFQDGDASGWNVADGNWVVVDDGGNYVYRYTGGGTNWAVSYVTQPGLSDLEVVAKMRAAANTSWIGLAFRIQDDANFLNFYQSRDVNQFKYARVINDNHTILQYPAFTMSAGAWYNLRVQAVGSLVRARLWPVGSVEPGTWNISYTDTTFQTQSNLGATLFQHITNADWDDFQARYLVAEEPTISVAWEDIPLWDDAWNTRQQLTIQNVSTSFDLVAKYTVQFTLDTESLIAAGRMQDTCNDLRLISFGGVDQIELDRLVDECNTDHTRVWFTLQRPISAAGQDNGYYLYYGNSSAGSPPADGMQVFLYYEDWEQGTSHWTSAGGLDPANTGTMGTSIISILDWVSSANSQQFPVKASGGDAFSGYIPVIPGTGYVISVWGKSDANTYAPVGFDPYTSSYVKGAEVWLWTNEWTIGPSWSWRSGQFTTSSTTSFIKIKSEWWSAAPGNQPVYMDNLALRYSVAAEPTLTLGEVETTLAVPVIGGVQDNGPIDLGEPIVVTADVSTEEGAINNVVLRLISPVLTDVSMSVVNGTDVDGTWEGSYFPLQGGEFSYRILAHATTGLSMLSPLHTIEVTDSQPPEISGLNFTDPLDVDATQTVIVTVTDNGQIASVSLTLGGISHPMTQDGSQYSYSWQVTTVGEISFTVVATDTSGNQAQLTNYFTSQPQEVDVCTWKDCKVGAESWSNDDGNTACKEVLEAGGMRGTYYYNGATTLSWFADYADAGHEIASHTVSHPCNTPCCSPYCTPETLSECAYTESDVIAYRQNQLEPNITAIEAGSGQPVLTLAWPCGCTDPGRMEAASYYYLGARGYYDWVAQLTWLQDVNQPTPVNFYNLNTANSYNQTFIDRAASEGTWAIVTSHGSCTGIDYMASRQDVLWAAPVGEVLEYIYIRDNAQFSSYTRSARTISFDVVHDLNPLQRQKVDGTYYSPIPFDDPVTLQIHILDSDIVESVSVDAIEAPFTIQTIQGARFVLINTPLDTSHHVVINLGAPAPTIVQVTDNGPVELGQDAHVTAVVTLSDGNLSSVELQVLSPIPGSYPMSLVLGTTDTYEANFTTVQLTGYPYQVIATSDEGGRVQSAEQTLQVQDTTSPEWNLMSQTFDTLILGMENELSVDGYDLGGLEVAILSTDESGIWQEFDWPVDNWWNHDWQHRIPVTLQETAGLARSAEVVDVVISSELLIGLTSCVNELRVADSASQELPVQVYGESNEGGVLTCHLLFPASVPPNGTSTYYIYFGNPEAVPPSYTTDLVNSAAGGLITIQNSFFNLEINSDGGVISRVRLPQGSNTNLPLSSEANRYWGWHQVCSSLDGNITGINSLCAGGTAPATGLSVATTVDGPLMKEFTFTSVKSTTIYTIIYRFYAGLPYYGYQLSRQGGMPNVMNNFWYLNGNFGLLGTGVGGTPVTTYNTYGNGNDQIRMASFATVSVASIDGTDNDGTALGGSNYQTPTASGLDLWVMTAGSQASMDVILGSLASPVATQLGAVENAPVGQYGSPFLLDGATDWTSITFAWQNPAVSVGTVVQWHVRICDLSGNCVITADQSFAVVAEVPWFSLNWDYRRLVHIASPCSTTESGYQVQILLDSDFDFSKSRIDGADLVITAADGVTRMPFWVESWDAVAQQAVVWVKLPELQPTGLDVYLYYGNLDLAPVETPPVGPFTRQGNIVPMGDPGSGASLLAENIVFDPVTGHYWMIFANYRDGSVGLVWSDDPGNPNAWNWHGNVASAANAPHLSYYEGTWYLFVADRSVPSPYPISVLTASSVTGPYVNRTPVLYPSADWDAYRVDEPYVFQRNDGVWVMMYMGDSGGAHEQVSFATAPNITGPYTKYLDGVIPALAWGPPGSFDAGTIADAWVVEFQGIYYIGYTVSPTTSSPWQTALATTTDWVTFTKNGIILPLGSGYDAQNAFRGAVTLVGDTYIFPYTNDSYRMAIATQSLFQSPPFGDRAAVFGFYDDFTGTTLDTTKWAIESGNASQAVVSGGLLTLTGGGSYIKINSTTTFPINRMVEVLARHPQAGTLNLIAEVGMSGGGFGNVVRWADDFHNTAFWEYQVKTTSVPGDPWTTSAIPADSNWHTFRTYRLLPNVAGLEIDQYAPIVTDVNVPTINLSAFLMSYGSGNQLVVDWVRTRSWCGSEASSSLGNEESRPTVARIAIDKSGPELINYWIDHDLPYTIMVENTGDLPLFIVTVSDPSTPACDGVIGNLAVGESISYVCVGYTENQSTIANTATVTGSTLEGDTVSASDTVITRAVQPSLAISIIPDQQTILTGSSAGFQVILTNSGDVDMVTVAVDSSDPGQLCSRSIPSGLAAAASTSYTCILPGITQGFTLSLQATATVAGLPGTFTASAQAQVSVTPADTSAPWMPGGWRYRIPAIISNPCAAPVESGYQVQVMLGNEFDFTKVLVDGSDLRVTSSDGVTLIPFWIESWNPAVRQASLWVKVPQIPTEGTIVYIYYGNANPPAPDLSPRPVPPIGPFDRQGNIVPIGDPGGGASLLAENIVFDPVTGHYWLVFANYRDGSVGLVWSDDPANPNAWNWHLGNPVQTRANAPHLLYHNGLWYLFYSDWSTAAPISISVSTATSVGGPYTKVGAVLSPTDAWEAWRVDEPYVLQRADGKWVIVYMADPGGYHEQVSYATADDILGPYTKYMDGDVPALAWGPPGSYDAGTIADPWVVEYQGTYYIGYTVSATIYSPWQTAVATTTDWQTFTKLGVILPLGSGYDAQNSFRGAVTQVGDLYIFPYTNDGYRMAIATQPTVGVPENPVNNHDAVFGFYDSFDGTQVDDTKWSFDPVGGSSGATLNDGVLTLISTSGVIEMVGNKAFGAGTLLEALARHPDADGSATTAAEVGLGTLGRANLIRILDYNQPTFIKNNTSASGGGNDFTAMSHPLDTQNYLMHRIYWASNTQTLFQLENDPWESLTTNVPGMALPPWLMVYAHPKTTRLQVDWLRVRNYCGADAAFSLLEEQIGNLPPTADDQSVTTAEDTALDITLTGSDPDGDSLSYVVGSQPLHGVLTGAAPDLTYTPEENWYGSDSFTFTISDWMDSATATVSITVIPVNDPPIAVDDSATTDEDMAVTIYVLGNDTDVEVDTLIVESVTQPSHGSVTHNGISVAYTPAINYNGLDSFTYTVSDGNGGTDTATVSITIVPVNDPPVAMDDSATTYEDTPITLDVLLNDTDIDGDSLSVSDVSAPGYGITNINIEGTITYLPGTDYNGLDSFTYTISDGNGGTAMATVDLTIIPVNDSPVANDDTATTDEDVAVTIDVLANDIDVDIDVLNVAEVTQPGHGWIVNNGTGVTYIPDENFNGNDSFSYTVSDGNGGTDVAEVTLTVISVNDIPVVFVGVDVTINEGEPFVGFGYFIDPDMNTWTATVDYGDGASIQTLALAGDKTFSLSHTYADNGGYTVTVCVTDDESATGCDSLDVTVENVTPVVNAGADATIDEGDTFTGSGWFTDPGADTWTATVDYGDGAGIQTLALAGDKTFSLSRTYADNGSYVVEVCVTDDEEARDCDTLIVTVLNVKPTVAILGAPESSPEGTEVSLTSSVVDPGLVDTFTYAWSVTKDGAAYASGSATAFAFTPDDNGTYVVSLIVTDDDGGVGNDDKTISVTNVAPSILVSNNGPINEGSSVLITVAASDPAGANDPLSYEFDCNNDGIYEVGPQTGNTASCLFNDNGLFTVGVRVNDGDGGITLASTSVTVQDLGPTAAFTWTPETQDEGSPVTFTDQSTSYPDFITSWSWDFGGLGTSALQNPPFTFMDNGTYNVCLTVTDDDGSTDEVCHDVTITDLAPTAAFTWAPEPQNEGAAVQFTDASTSYPDDIVSWSWDFGGLGTSALPNPTFIFLNNGTYNVCLIVTDDDESTNTSCHDVTVENVAPTVSVGTDTTIDEGDTFTGSGWFTDPGADTWTATVDYGDGSGVQPLTLSGKTFSLSHTYADNGSYTVTVCVTDDDNATGCDSLVVAVNNVAPVVSVTPRSQSLQYSDGIMLVTFAATDVAADALVISTAWSSDGVNFTPGLPGYLELTYNGCSVNGYTHTCTWTVSGAINLPAGTYVVRGTVTDDDGVGSSANTTLVVSRENAKVTFDSDNPVAVQVATPGGVSPSFSLYVDVQEAFPDTGNYPYSGDITNAGLSITLVPVGPGTPITVACTPVSTDGSGYGKVVTFSCPFSEILVNTYTAQANVTGGYYLGGSEDVLVVYDPSLGFTTGGGWFYWPGTEDPDTGYPGDRSNFGYTMSYNKKGGNVKGSLLIIRHLQDGTIYRFKSNALYGLALGQDPSIPMGWASFSGKGTYLEPGWVEPIGNYEFTVYVEDRNEPGTGEDRFWIEVRDKDRIIEPDLSMADPAVDNAVILYGGNIVVPHRVK